MQKVRAIRFKNDRGRLRNRLFPPMFFGALKQSKCLAIIRLLPTLSHTQMNDVYQLIHSFVLAKRKLHGAKTVRHDIKEAKDNLYWMLYNGPDHVKEYPEGYGRMY